MIGCFTPEGKTAKIVTTATASTGAQIKSTPSGQSGALVQNNLTGAKDAWLAWGASNVAAVIPTGVGANAQNGIMIAAGKEYLLNFPPDTYFSAICGGSDSTSVFITRGEIR